MNRLTIMLAVLACLAFAAPAGAGQRLHVAATPVATTAQEEPTETTPAQDDPDEEEIGEDIDPPPEQEAEPEEEEESAPAPAPAPVATPAPAELPRTGTDHRPLLAAAALVLMGLALRRVTRPG